MFWDACSARTIAATCLASTPWSIFTGQTVVDLGYARYQGIALESGSNQYLGMRYAAAPTGNLRFRAPVSPPVIPGLQSATSFQPICLGIGTKTPSVNEAEDCLFLNVWSPSTATPESKLPVWVYIQGGGYNTNSNANYNGSEVVSTSGQNIVFVNFNYRVASWGFLASEKVRSDGDLNVGLLDQRLALEWVQNHIEKFGGDPDHVVIHGVSAGGGSVALHLTAYGGHDDGLFNGAILESPFLPTHPPVSELEWQFDNYVYATGCTGSIDHMACLRSKDTETLQIANRASPYPERAASPRFYWTPTIDGDFIQDYPYRMFEKGSFIKLPVVIGDDTDEGSGFAVNASSTAEISGFFMDNYPRLTPTDTEAINSHYPLTSPIPLHASYFPSASAAYGEATFTCPGNTISAFISAYFSPEKVWNYRYNVQDQLLIDLGLGVPHTFESPAIFGVGNARDDLDSSYTTYNKEIVPIVMNYWISFVRELDPNVWRYGEAPKWESWSSEEGKERRLMMETNRTKMEDLPAEQTQNCELWKSLADAMWH